MNIGPIEREHAEDLYEAALHHDLVALDAVVKAIESSWTRDSRGIPAKVEDIFCMVEPCELNDHYIIDIIAAKVISGRQVGSRGTISVSPADFSKSAIIKRLVPAGGGE